MLEEAVQEGGFGLKYLLHYLRGDLGHCYTKSETEWEKKDL